MREWQKDTIKNFKMNDRKKGVIVSYAYVIIHLVVNLIYVPILLHYLGKGEYGLYQIVGSFFTYIAVFETSISSGTLRFYCEAIATQNDCKMENSLALSRIIYRLFSVATIIISGIVILLFRQFYLSSFSVWEIRESTWMLIALFINFFVTLQNAIYLSAINANEKFAFTKLLSIISQILQPLICILFLRSYPYAYVVVFVQLCLNIGIAIVRYIYAHRKLKVKIQLHQFDKSLIQKMLLFSLSILLANIADQIFWKTDQVILGKLYNTTIVAVYSVGVQIYMNYMYLSTSIATVFFPKLSKLNAEKDGIQKISNLFIQVGRVQYQVLLLVLSGFLIFGKEFISLWVGSNYLEAYKIAIVVMIPFTIDLIQNLGLSILQILNKYNFRAKMYFIAALLNIIGTIILAKAFGAVGAAWATGLTMLITNGFIMNYYYQKKIRLNILGFWKNIVTITLKLLPLILVFCFINSIAKFTYSWFNFLIKIILFLILYCLFDFLFVMNLDEKNMIKKLLKRGSSRA